MSRSYASGSTRSRNRPTARMLEEGSNPRHDGVLGCSSGAGPLADARRGIENRGDVLEQLQPAVKGAVLHQFEGDVGVPVEDPVTAGGTGDDGEDDDPVTIHQAGLEKRPAEAEAADGAHRPT